MGKYKLLSSGKNALKNLGIFLSHKKDGGEMEVPFAFLGNTGKQATPKYGDPELFWASGPGRLLPGRSILLLPQS